jgi:hypothetical protein
MAIPVTCPSCSFEGDAPDEMAGQFVLCPDCRSNIPVEDPRRNRVSERPSSERRLERPSRRPFVDDDEDDDDRPNGRRSRLRPSRLGSVCPYCGSDSPPHIRNQISAAGWITFVLLLVLGCWPFFIIGLFIKEDVRHCADCGRKL